MATTEEGPDLEGTQGSLLLKKKELEERAPLVGTPMSSWCLAVSPYVLFLNTTETSLPMALR